MLFPRTVFLMVQVVTNPQKLRAEVSHHFLCKEETSFPVFSYQEKCIIFSSHIFWFFPPTNTKGNALSLLSTYQFQISIFFFFSVVLLALLFYPSMESMQAYTEVSDDSSQDKLHDAQTTNEKGIINLSKERMKPQSASPPSFVRRDRRGEPHSARPPSFVRRGEPHSARPPSFVRRDRRGASRERNDFQRGDLMIRQSVPVPGLKKVVVRPRTSIVQTNDHNNQVRMEGDKEIYEEEAVCKFCFAILKEDENILKTECCEILLMHEACAANQSRGGNNPCVSCGQEVRSFPVTLLTGLGSAQRMETQESNKQSWISRLIRCWKCGF